MLSRSLKNFSRHKKLLHHQFVKASGPTKQNLLIVHGVLGHGGLYRHLATNQKTHRNFNSYLVDMRNHGKSFWTDTISVPELAQDIKHWMDAQNFEDGSVTVVGHSLGGRAIISLTQQFPEMEKYIKKLIMVDVAPHTYSEFAFVPKSMEFLQKLKALDFNQSEQEILKYVKSICVNEIQESMVRMSLDIPNKKFVYNVQTILKDYLLLASYGCKHTQWKGPLYLLRALKANYVTDYSKQQYKRLYKGFQQSVDVDCYHNVHLQRPYEIIKLLYK